MYIKTFKYPVNNTMITLKKDDGNTVTTSTRQVKVLQEIIVNRYIDVVREKFSLSNDDIQVDINSTVENDKSFLIYTVIFKTLSYSQILTLSAEDFKV